MPILTSLPDKGYFVLRDEIGGGFEHNLGGSAPGRCPSCGNRLLQLLSLDLRDERLGIDWPLGRLRLLFCWRCPFSQDWSYGRIAADGEFEWIRYVGGSVERDFPYPDYPEFFPEVRVTLRPIPDRAQMDLILLNEGREAECSALKVEENLDTPRHQIGGTPLMMQPVACASCPECRSEMPFFATVGDGTGSDRGFTGNPFVQVLYFVCRRCRVVAAIQVCD